jgi:bifunctional DNase/RNase
MESEVKLVISGLVYNQTVVGTYGLILSEEYGNRRFSVMIGEPEAQSIALKLNNKKSSRPLTHDLIKTILSVFDAQLLKVVIYDMVNDVFFSELHILKDDNVLIVDARTSDAVALAVRSDCSIYIKSEILDIVGIVVEKDLEKEEVTTPDIENISDEELDNLSIEELNSLLEMAVKDEKYEKAVILRDAIKRRQNNSGSK